MTLLPMALLTTATSCSKDDGVIELDKDNNDGQQNQEIIVTVDDNGNVDGGHRFTKVDETNFYIDDIKYTTVSGNLKVTDYDKALFSGGGATIISMLKYKGRTWKVVGIADYAFMHCSNLTSITIPNSVTSIGSYAFRYCSSLTSVTIGNSVTSIGNRAFEDCTSLTSVTIPNGVTSIGYYTFSGCSSMTSITIPNSVTSIGDHAFYYCSSLTSITIPNSVTSIGECAFSGCRGLTSITIPNSVTSIGNYAFSGCSGLTSITIPNSVTSIGDDAFNGCYFLPNSIINNTTLTSGNNWGATLCDVETSEGLLIKDVIAIKCRPWAASITIPNSVTNIGECAFSGCRGLTSITIPNSVTSIGNYAFSGCGGLKDFYCHAKNVPNTESSSFYNSNVELITLHVPAASVDAYKAKLPWKNFGSIVPL